MSQTIRSLFASLMLGVAVLALPVERSRAGEGDLATVEKLGEALFFDVDLSANRTQSCASCHNPERGFVDPLETRAGRAASLGADGRSLGDRNAPTVAYARFVPPFGRAEDGAWRGGLFHDGRAADLEEQAGGPPLNPLEMAMPSKAAVVARLKEKPAYVAAFARLFGPTTLDDAETGYAAMTRAVAAFERTDLFAPFDSKYDRSLRGEATLTEEEELGRVLFFSTQFTNCSRCHRSESRPGAAGELFTDQKFHDIGVPTNRALRAVNGVARSTRDLGLGANPAVAGDRRQDGRFRTPTLRNVAVTGPYMHNGVFADLRTVILFYNKSVTRSPARLIDPETGRAWARPEVGRHLAEELTAAPPLDDRRIDALVAFLRTLTDRRWEPLLGK